MIKIYSFLILLILYSNSVFAIPPDTVSYVDLEKYQGRWYAVAVLRKSFYQRRCEKDSIVEYILSQDSQEPIIKAKNSCRFFSGKAWQDKAEIKVADPTSNSLLYIPRYRGSLKKPNYYIIGLAEDTVLIDIAGSPGKGYRWVLVSDHKLRNAWLMVRNPGEATSIMQEAANQIENSGIDLCSFYLEPQIGADYITDNTSRETTVADYLGIKTCKNN